MKWGEARSWRNGSESYKSKGSSTFFFFFFSLPVHRCCCCCCLSINLYYYTVWRESDGKRNDVILLCMLFCILRLGKCHCLTMHKAGEQPTTTTLGYNVSHTKYDSTSTVHTPYSSSFCSLLYTTIRVYHWRDGSLSLPLTLFRF